MPSYSQCKSSITKILLKFNLILEIYLNGNVGTLMALFRLDIFCFGDVSDDQKEAVYVIFLHNLKLFFQKSFEWIFILSNINKYNKIRIFNNFL